MIKKTLISVVGPTAIGKTKLAIALAQHFKTDIISADSRQFYKEMRIGTAVPTDEELQSAKHHFIQHKSIQESYSVGDFEKEALLLLRTLFQKTNVVVLVGGSGLYVDAVTTGLDYFPKINPEIRLRLNAELQEHGLIRLQEQLKTLDASYYEQVDLENPHRLIRALEVCIGSGKPYSSFIRKVKPKRPFNICSVGITADREIIYDRINRRVDLMLAGGLLEETKSLYHHKELNALQTVGYKEMFKHFDGAWELDFALSEVKKNTRRFAKRQLTWFKKNENTLWVDFETKAAEVIDKVEKHIHSMHTTPIICVMGVSGCGKSTIGKRLAKEFDIPFFDGDDYHSEANVKKMAAGIPLNDQDRKAWLERLNALLVAHKNKGLIIACSALKKRYREILSQKITNQLEFVYLEGTFEEISERLQQRKDHFMPAGLLQSQFDTLEAPTKAITISILKTPLEITSKIVALYKTKKP